MKKVKSFIEVEFTENATSGLIPGERKKLIDHLALKLIESGSAIRVSEVKEAEVKEVKTKKTKKK